MPTVNGALRAAVYDRDDMTCVRCGDPISPYWPGFSVHHRRGRRGTEGNRLANLILLCGSGTTGCHGWVHANPEYSYEAGLLVHRWDGPTMIPVLCARRGRILLDNNGGWETAK